MKSIEKYEREAGIEPMTSITRGQGANNGSTSEAKKISVFYDINDRALYSSECQFELYCNIRSATPSDSSFTLALNKPGTMGLKHNT